MKRFLLPLLLALIPATAGAQTTHVIDTFAISDAKAHGIDGCGLDFSRFEDFHPAPDYSTAFVFVNDYERGLVRIDGQDVIVKVTDDDTDAKPAQARFASEDGKVVVEESYSVIETIGDELSYTMGIVTFIIGDERQSLSVRGGLGC